MGCYLLGAKSLPEPMVTYARLNPQEQVSMKYDPKYKTFQLNAFPSVVKNEG